MPDGIIDVEARAVEVPNALAVKDDRKLTARDAEDMEKRVQIIARFRRAVVGMTVSKQWADFGGSPHMEADAAYVIGEAFGVTICGPGPMVDGQLPGPEFEEISIAGGAVQIICRLRVFTGAAESPDREVFEEGECDSFDPYLKGRKANLEENGATEEQITSLIKPRIRKKALANAVSRGVSGFTGLRGLSWDDLRRLGLTREGASANVDFGQGKGGGEVKAVESVAALSQLPLKSKVSLLAEISGPVRGFAKFSLIPVKDKTGTIELHVWKPASEIPVWVKPGAWIHSSEVIVGDYKGRRQYVASNTAKGEPPADAAPPAEGPDLPDVPFDPPEPGSDG